MLDFDIHTSIYYCVYNVFMACSLVTVLPCINAELVDTGWGLSQNINGMAGCIHVVEEVDGQGREGQHQQPQHSQYICHHYKLYRQESTIRIIMVHYHNNLMHISNLKECFFFMNGDSLSDHIYFFCD